MMIDMRPLDVNLIPYPLMQSFSMYTPYKNIMTKHLSILILLLSLSCQAQRSIITDHVTIKISTYKYGNEMKVSPMPELKAESGLMKYKRRFEYLIMNISEIHLPARSKDRKRIFDLYPDTTEIKRLYLKALNDDKKLVGYFEETKAPISDPKVKVNKMYTSDELMEVASKFFYCDKVNPDTSIQSRICIGVNGLSEAKWEKDYTLLSAFCYEAIFNDLDQDVSQIRESYRSEKKNSTEQFRKNMTALDKYLEDVKEDLFTRMKNNVILQKALLDYYQLHKNDLAFEIIK